MNAWGAHIFGIAVMGAATGGLVAYARFLWRCAQPIKHWSEDFTDCAWGDVIAFPHIADRHLDFVELEPTAVTERAGESDRGRRQWAPVTNDIQRGIQNELTSTSLQTRRQNRAGQGGF